jgi:hypothetical protein
MLILPAACGSVERNEAAISRPLGTAVANPVWKPEYQKSLDAAVKWLLENQQKDGHWGHFLPTRPGDVYIGGVNSLRAFEVASSSLCAMALLELPENEAVTAALLKGYSYLADAPEARRIDPSTFYNTWAHCYLLQAISRGILDNRLENLHPALRKRGEIELKELLGIQCLNGGFGYYDFYQMMTPPSGEMATSFGTATALAVFKEAQKAGYAIPGAALASALDFLIRLRYPNGSYAYSFDSRFYPMFSANQIRGSLGRSQACNNGLFLWERIGSRDVKNGLVTFFKEHGFIEIGRCRQWPHEAWYCTAPYYYYYGHFYASCNLDFLTADDAGIFAAQLADTVVATQFSDGSFWDYPLFGYTKAYGTGLGILILANCHKHLK